LQIKKLIALHILENYFDNRLLGFRHHGQALKLLLGADHNIACPLDDWHAKLLRRRKLFPKGRRIDAENAPQEVKFDLPYENWRAAWTKRRVISYGLVMAEPMTTLKAPSWKAF
jgi:hypothetical protein